MPTTITAILEETIVREVGQPYSRQRNNSTASIYRYIEDIGATFVTLAVISPEVIHHWTEKTLEVTTFEDIERVSAFCRRYDLARFYVYHNGYVEKPDH